MWDIGCVNISKPKRRNEPLWIWNSTKWNIDLGLHVAINKKLKSLEIRTQNEFYIDFFVANANLNANVNRYLNANANANANQNGKFNKNTWKRLIIEHYKRIKQTISCLIFIPKSVFQLP